MIEKEDAYQESPDWGFGSWGFHDVFFVCLCYDWYFLIWSSNIVVCFYKLNACLDVVLVVDTQYQAGLVEIIGILSSFIWSRNFILVLYWVGHRWNEVLKSLWKIKTKYTETSVEATMLSPEKQGFSSLCTEWR